MWGTQKFLSCCFLASVAGGGSEVWLVGVFTRLPLSSLLRDSSLKVLQSSLGLNTTSYVSPPRQSFFYLLSTRGGGGQGVGEA